MGLRMGILLFFTLGMLCACDARKLVVSRFSDQVAHNSTICTKCEQYVTLALDYLENNKTQAEIIEALHRRCSLMPSLEQKCVTLVDYYARLFFSELSVIQPGDFCRKANLCEKVEALALEANQNSCEVCNRTVTEVLEKLNDPQTKLEILEFLLKQCKLMNNLEKKCKRIVFEYAPLILANAEEFLKKEDICTLVHACPASAKTVVEALDLPAVADS